MDADRQRSPGGSVIASPANPKVKALVAMRRRRDRDAGGLTVIDGYDELALALDAGVAIEGLYLCPELAGDERPIEAIAERAAVSAYRLSKAAFEKASYRDNPDGWLAVVRSPGTPLAELRLPTNALVLVAERVEKPGNLGAMLRTADAAGAAAVVSADPGTDWGNPNVIRASRGTVFAVSVASATTVETIDWLRSQQVAIAVATPDGAAALGEAILPRPLAIVVGAEHQGVGAEWRRAADIAVRIPMHGRVNSLNVATSAAIVLFEAVRQRTQTE